MGAFSYPYASSVSRPTATATTIERGSYESSFHASGVSGSGNANATVAMDQHRRATTSARASPVTATIAPVTGRPTGVRSGENANTVDAELQWLRLSHYAWSQVLNSNTVHGYRAWRFGALTEKLVNSQKWAGKQSSGAAMAYPGSRPLGAMGGWIDRSMRGPLKDTQADEPVSQTLMLYVR